MNILWLSQMMKVVNIIFICWSLQLKQSTVNTVIDQWRPKLQMCLCAKGQHFEQLLN